jgi:hypothetical protein
MRLKQKKSKKVLKTNKTQPHKNGDTSSKKIKSHITKKNERKEKGNMNKTLSSSHSFSRSSIFEHIVK